MKIRVTKKNVNDGDGDDKPTNTITNQNRQDWNNYIDYLKTKGLAGNPLLDKGGFGVQVLQDYIKNNPNTSLTVDMVKPIQSDFSNYRNFALDQVKQNKAAFAPNTNETNFMTELSKLDNYGGSLTTKHKFPLQYMQYIESNQPTRTVSQGFATTK